jgi:hypothetical protein
MMTSAFCWEKVVFQKEVDVAVIICTFIVPMRARKVNTFIIFIVMKYATTGPTAILRGNILEFAGVNMTRIIGRAKTPAGVGIQKQNMLHLLMPNPN